MKQTLTHIKDEEAKQFVKTVLDYSRRSEMQYRPFFTSFYSKDWMETILTQYVPQTIRTQCSFFGGFEGAQRQILALAPYPLNEEDFPIGALEVKVKIGIGKALSHRDFLGALLGLGIERETIGDIIIKPFGAYVIAEEAILTYISATLLGIGRYQQIEHHFIAFKDLEVDMPSIKEVQTTVASLRLDIIIAAAFGLSRGVADKLLKAGKVKCNGIVGTSTQLIKEGDVITVRGYGKVRFKQINGQTKKDRLHITIEKYI